MKKSFFIILLTALMMTPLAAMARDFKVTFTNDRAEAIISKLEKATGYEFVCRKEVVNGIKHPAEGSYTASSVKDLLNEVVRGAMGLDYEIVDNTVILRLPSKDIKGGEKRTLSGRVLDDRGEPLPGAYVHIEGSTVGAATDIDGNFEFTSSAPYNYTLLVSYVGMKPRETVITPSTRFPLTIKMETNYALMDEVVVTGYQNLKRENATGAYQTITADDIQRRYSSSVTDNLEGQVPGLVIYNNGIKDGEDAMTIRGTGSFQAVTKPLVVVDGLPIEGGIETVNPYDIQNITVLKDAAAASIYGARASNGIIVITTKQAVDERVSIDFNTDITVTERQKYDNMGWASSSELLELEQYQFNSILNNSDRSFYNEMMNRWNDNRTHNFSPALKLLVRNHLGELSDSDLNSQFSEMGRNDYRKEWRDAMTTTDVLQQYNLALRLRSKNLQSSVVVNYKRDNMGRVREHNDAITFKYRGDLKLAKWVDMAFGVNVISERSKTRPTSVYGYLGQNSFRPYETMYNPDGSLKRMQAGIDPDLEVLQDPYNELKDVTFNLMNERNLNWQRDRRTNIRTFLNGTFKILPGWTASGFFQYEDIYYKSDVLTHADSYEMRRLYNLYSGMTTVLTEDYDEDWNPILVPSQELVHHIPNGGMLETLTNEGAFYTFRAQTQYATTLFDKHDIDFLGGFEFRETHEKAYSNLLMGYDEQTQMHSTGMVNWSDIRDAFGSASILGSDYTMMGAPDWENGFRPSDVLHRFYSIYFTGNYVYDNRYALSGSWRIDKTDLFGADPEFRGRPLWSVGASWNAHNEAFLRDVKWLNALKPRVSYGLTGNIDSSVSSFMTATIGINWNNGDKNAWLDTPPNEQLRWEKTSTWNVGVDFSLLNYRLNGSLDYYRKNGSDLLTLTDLDVTTGWTQLTINNGEMVNDGIELQLSGRIIEPKGRNSLGVRASMNFSYNNNKVTKVNHRSPDGYTELLSTTLHEGYPIHSLFSYEFAGLERNGNNTTYTWRDREGNVHNSNLYSSDFTPEEAIYSGSLDPKYIASLIPEISYGGFTLSAMMSYYGGHKMRADTDRWSSYGDWSGYPGYALSSDLDFWRNGEDLSIVPNGYLGGTNINGTYQYASCNVMAADYLKVRNVVLSYLFPSTLTRKIGINELRLRLQMNNVATWARNNLGLDPEAVNPVTGENLTRTPRSYTFSLFLNL